MVTTIAWRVRTGGVGGIGSPGCGGVCVRAPVVKRARVAAARNLRQSAKVIEWSESVKTQ
jgi:hypothetical protein